MTVLDRYLAWRCASAFVSILVALLVVMSAIDATARIGEATRRADGAILLLRLYLLRIPEQTELLATPAMLIAILVACTPMLRRGEFVALAAAGVSPWRSLRAAFAFGAGISLLLLALSDAVVPLTAPTADLVQDALEDQIRDGKCWTIASTGTDWFAAHARTPSDRELEFAEVAACPPGGGMLRGDRLRYHEGRWEISGHLCRAWAGSDGSYGIEFPERFALDGPWSIPLTPADLHAAMASDGGLDMMALIRRGLPRDLAIVGSRIAHALAPLLASLVLVPLFVRFANRDHLVAALVRSLVAAAAPCAILALADYANALRAPLLADLALAGLAASPGLIVVSRWRL